MNYQSKCGELKSTSETLKPRSRVPSKSFNPSQIPIKTVGCCSRPANSSSSKKNPSSIITISSVKPKNSLLPIKSSSPVRIISGNRPASRSSTNLTVPSTFSTSSSTAKSAPDLRILACCSSKIKSPTTFRRTGYQIGGKYSPNSNASSGCKCSSNSSVPVPKMKIKRL